MRVMHACDLSFLERCTIQSDDMLSDPLVVAETCFTPLVCPAMAGVTRQDVADSQSAAPDRASRLGSV
jgi:hypothetical protein